ncbi:MAG TPA: ABC transporter permease subunit, partial [Acidimicrobiales bacterium]
MEVETPPVAGDDLAVGLAGLDALELGPAGTTGSIARAWAAAWPKVAALALAVGLWQAVVWSHWKPAFVLPGPGPVLRALGHDAGTAAFWQAAATTMRRAAVGYGLAVVIGLALGGLVARSRILRSAVGAFITGLQTMPSVTWFPLAILLFKLSEGAITFVVVIGAAPSIANGFVSGIDHVPPLLLRSGRMLGARGLVLWRHVVVPAALPSLVAGLKQGWAFAWRSLMAGE